MCSLADLRTILTLDDLADMHEALDLREHLAAKAAAAERERSRQRDRRRTHR
jgi:hypothetical protein